mgnify:CR=1 FL=1
MRTTALLALIIALAALFVAGRPLWLPIYQQVMGKRSVNDVLVTYGPEARQRLAPFFEQAGPLRFMPLIACGVFVFTASSLVMKLGLEWWTPVFSPIGMLLLLFTMLRSAFICWRNGGISWRGSLYPVDVLRREQRVRLLGMTLRGMLPSGWTGKTKT